MAVASATFDNKNVRTTHTVTAAGYTLTSGNGNADAGNYVLTQPAATNVTISPRSLTITGNRSDQDLRERQPGQHRLHRSGLQNGETIGSVTLTAVNIGSPEPAPPATATPALENHALGGRRRYFRQRQLLDHLANASTGLTVNKATLTLTGFAVNNKTCMTA